MNKRLRSILVTLCVGVLALVVFFVVQTIINNQPDGGEGTKTNKQITKYEVGDVASVKVELANGEYYFVTEDAIASQGGSNVDRKSVV